LNVCVTRRVCVSTIETLSSFEFATSSVVPFGDSAVGCRPTGIVEG
jgi:hypothetical protein